MKGCRRSTIVAGVACSLVLLGVTPLAYLYWWGAVHNLRPLSMEFPLKRGEHSSPFFKTALNDTYQIDLAWGL